MAADGERSLKVARGRPRGFDEREALARATRLFWERGWAASLDELVAATGVSRASLYAVYGDKERLFLACLELYSEEFEAKVTALLDREPEARGAIAAFLETAATRLTDPAEPAGCLRANSTLECRGLSAAIDSKLVELNARYEGLFRKRLARGREEGELPPDEDVGALARYVAGTANGMIVLARGGADRAALLGIAALAMRAWPTGPRIQGAALTTQDS